LPPGLPESLLEPVRDPAGDLVSRYARSHGPFSARELADRFGLGTAVAEALLARLADTGRIVEGEFRPGGSEREWVDADVLRSLRRRSLAKLRQEIEPVDADALGRFMMSWHGVGSGRHGLETLLDAIEQLQGAAVPATVLESQVLPARVSDYQPAMLDALMAAGEVVWVGVEPIGERDGRVALYLTDHVLRLRAPAQGTDPSTTDGRAGEIASYLRTHGASFFAAIHDGTGQGFPQETVDALWELVWKGIVTNDTLHALRAYVRPEDKRQARRGRPMPFRSRRLLPRAAEGRWSLIDTPRATKASTTEWSAALAQQLLARHGIVTRETVASAAVAGGFSAVYQVLRAMEDAGRIRRGYFVAGLGGAQFAMPSALDLLRSMREPPDEPRTAVLAATDPANPYGSILKWPEPADTAANASLAPRHADADAAGRPARTVGALVVVVDGFAAAYLRRGERELLLFGSDAEPRRSQRIREVARMLLYLAGARGEGRRGMLIAEINGVPASRHPAARLFIEEGFATTAMGLQARTDRLRPSGFVPAMLAAGGTGIAGSDDGGTSMADSTRDKVKTPRRNETNETEHDRVRSSNDKDQALEREGVKSEHNRGYDDATRGNPPREQSQDVDPDSAESEVDRDDMLTE
jgi:ATP-dependent Lhr-like helicase